MSKRELAIAIHTDHTTISSSMSGNPKYANDKVKMAICTYLGVKDE